MYWVTYYWKPGPINLSDLLDLESASVGNSNGDKSRSLGILDGMSQEIGDPTLDTASGIEGGCGHCGRYRCPGLAKKARMDQESGTT
ncbi:hypothetical protein CR513_48908, partial [Mucuna pruriens]